MRPLVHRSISCVELQQLNSSVLSAYKGQLVLIKSSFQEGRRTPSATPQAPQPDFKSVLKKWEQRRLRTEDTSLWLQLITFNHLHGFAFVLAATINEFFLGSAMTSNRTKTALLTAEKGKCLFSVTLNHLNHSEVARQDFLLN